MKTTRYISTTALRAASIIAVMMFALNLSSCSSGDATEPATPGNGNDQVSSARVTFTYTIPEEVLKYAEITVCYNNNEGTDAKWQPMLDPTFTVTYDITKFPVTAPVVMIYDFNNRPAGGVMVDWTLKMDIEVAMVVGGRTEIKTAQKYYNINGDAAKGIETLQKNVLDRTFSVKIAKTGNVQFGN